MYPLKLSAPLRDYIWGGERLKTQYGFKSDKKIAEAWVLSNREDGQSLVLNGELAGKTLGEAIAYFGDGCLGKNARAFKYFPLLIKLIDAKDKLSVQVHPNDDYSLEKEGEFGKTEMWHVLDAAPGAQLIYGLKRAVSKAELEEYINADRITELCNFVPVKKGDTFFIPAGTVHAIGEGMLIAEVQQNSNITYRVSDYGRLGADGKPRARHREKAIEVISREPTPPSTGFEEIKTAGASEKQLASCKYFNVKLLKLDGENTLLNNDSFLSILGLEGECSLSYDGGKTALNPADSVFVPAGLNVTLNGKATLLVSSV
ncbi:MAG: class I mannose-6-phosphate isomerase [Clostridia bacterium]|nr:class I mannose-6-phosphate isomerase [Clostridia bacterium]